MRIWLDEFDLGRGLKLFPFPALPPPPPPNGSNFFLASGHLKNYLSAGHGQSERKAER
jgi:hypothetical protein